MRGKSTKIKRIKEKIVSSMLIAMLLAITLGTISVSAVIVSVDDPDLNYYYIDFNGCYASDYIGTDTNASVYSQPTYGVITKEGKQILSLEQKTIWGESNVLYRILPLYKRTNESQTVSYKLGEASGKQLYFLVGSYDGSNGACFHLKKFHGEMRY